MSCKSIRFTGRGKLLCDLKGRGIYRSVCHCERNIIEDRSRQHVNGVRKNGIMQDAAFVVRS